MKISERIRRANGEKPDYAIDDIGDIGHWQGMNDAALIAEAEELVQLTDDQQVLLDELKVDQNGWYPFFTIWHLMEETDSIHMPTKEQFQVLAAFAEWGCNQ